MAGAGMRDVKRRIKSVESTMQITKAMQLVASSKLRKAKERVETARPYFNTLYETICEMSARNTDRSNDYTSLREVKKAAYLVIAGDRGLAGGYNSNVFKFASVQMQGKDALVIPVGKKAVEYFKRHESDIRTTGYETVEEMDLEKSFELARLVTDLYREGEVDEVYFIYTDFISMLTQEPTCKKILPLTFDEQEVSEITGVQIAEKKLSYAEFDPSIGAVLARIVPQYVGGMIFGCVCESFASEQGARRTAMEAASDNAQDAIASLSLKYNRARQGSITQEITEIAGGAEALK